MQQRVTPQQHAHIVAQVQRFVQLQIAQAATQTNYNLQRMHVHDAAYNDTALQQYMRSKRWDKLHSALMQQDTDPRECVFACIVEHADAAALKLTWEFINTY